LEEIMIMPVTDFLWYPRFFDPPLMDILEGFKTLDIGTTTSGMNPKGTRISDMAESLAARVGIQNG
jgi:hypothetical protein